MMCNLIIIDFDDTLVCSTWLAASATSKSEDTFEKRRGLIMAQAEVLDTKVVSFLSVALRKGNVKIVSNAEHAWIDYVLENFFRSLHAFIRKHGIEVISARECYQAAYPADFLKWKEDCFRKQVAEAIKTVQDTDRQSFMVVSIGDGPFERVACKIVANEFNVPYCSLKLLDAPNPQVLCHEIEIMSRCFDELVANPCMSAPGATREESVHPLCNDLFFDFDKDGGICIYHWEKRLENKVPSSNVPPPPLSSLPASSPSSSPPSPPPSPVNITRQRKMSVSDMKCVEEEVPREIPSCAIIARVKKKRFVDPEIASIEDSLSVCDPPYLTQPHKLVKQVDLAIDSICISILQHEEAKCNILPKAVVAGSDGSHNKL
jgi:hypothetical protein